MNRDEFEKVLKNHYEALGCSVYVDLSEYPLAKILLRVPCAVPYITLEFNMKNTSLPTAFEAVKKLIPNNPAEFLREVEDEGVSDGVVK